MLDLVQMGCLRCVRVFHTFYPVETVCPFCGGERVMALDRLKIEVDRIRPTAVLPHKGTQGSSGWDLAADIRETVLIRPQTAFCVPTGLRIRIPAGWEGQIRSRSGLAAKYEVSVLNSPGTIDSDYRGEIQVILFNHGQNSFSLQPQMRVAQIVFAPVFDGFLEEAVVSETETSRGPGGIGSTGL